MGPLVTSLGFSVGWSEAPTCDELRAMFGERDAWLAEFIFRNFGVEGALAMRRVYDRVRE